MRGMEEAIILMLIHFSSIWTDFLESLLSFSAKRISWKKSLLYDNSAHKNGEYFIKKHS